MSTGPNAIAATRNARISSNAPTPKKFISVAIISYD
jgi:hypothetical protein